MVRSGDDTMVSAMAMSESLRTNRMASLGMFSFVPPYIEGVDGGAEPIVFGGKDRHNGVQFHTASGKSGSGPDSTLNKFISNNVGSTFITPEELRRQYDREKKAKMISNKPFTPTSPASRLTGLGSHYGLLSKFENMKVDTKYDRVPPPKKGNGGKKGATPKQTVVTSPHKKGSYGYVGTNIGGKPGGSLGEFKYISPATGPMGPDGRPLLPPRPPSAPALTLAMMKPPQPTKFGSYHLTNIGGKSEGVAGEYSYVSDGRYSKKEVAPVRSHTSEGVRGEGFEESGQTTRQRSDSAAKTKQSTHKAFGPGYFRPSTGSKLGGGTYGGIGQYPPAMCAAVRGKEEGWYYKFEKTSKANKRLRGPVFRPGGSSRTVRTQSAMQMRLNRF